MKQYSSTNENTWAIACEVVDDKETIDKLLKTFHKFYPYVEVKISATIGSRNNMVAIWLPHGEVDNEAFKTIGFLARTYNILIDEWDKI